MDAYENGSHAGAQWKLAGAVVQHGYRGQVPQTHYSSPHGLMGKGRNGLLLALPLLRLHTYVGEQP